MEYKMRYRQNKNDLIEGVVFDIQKYSIHDGPGIRTLVFLKGCPLRCWWCSNPESQAMEPEEYLSTSTHESRIIGKTYTVKEVMEIIMQDFTFYETSGGGVTVGGGEALMQPEFLKALLHECTRMGIDTAIETSGYSSWKNFNSILPYLDLVFLDIKTMDKQSHKENTEKSNQLILKNAANLLKENTPVVIRIPVIPGVNDYLENIRSTAEFLREHNIKNNLRYVELLEYHEYGKQKYQALGRKFKSTDGKVVPKNFMAEAKEILQSYSLKTHEDDAHLQEIDKNSWL